MTISQAQSGVLCRKPNGAKGLRQILVPEIESNEFEKATAIAPNQHEMSKFARGASSDQAWTPETQQHQ
jgi:hypothetical protein